MKSAEWLFFKSRSKKSGPITIFKYISVQALNLTLLRKASLMRLLQMSSFATIPTSTLTSAYATTSPLIQINMFISNLFCYIEIAIHLDYDCRS